MKTFQLDIEEKYFPELKQLLNMLPKESVKLFGKNGSQITINDEEFEVSEELQNAIKEGIAELDRGEGIPHEQVVEEMQAKYSNLNFRLKLRNTITEYLSHIEDESFLWTLKNLIESKLTDGVYTLNEEQKNRIELARLQLKDGQTTSNDDLQKEINQWLSSK